MSATRPPAAAAFLYDADCGFCTRSVAFLGRRLARPDLFVPWQGVDAAACGIDPARLEREAVWWDGRQATQGGAMAFAAVLAHVGGAWGVIALIMRAPFVRHLAASCYRLVARNRHRLPGDACTLAPPGSPARAGQTGSETSPSSATDASASLRGTTRTV